MAAKWKEWEFTVTMIRGYGRLIDPKGNDFNVEFDQECNIQVTTTKRQAAVKVPQKVEDMIKEEVRKSAFWQEVL